MDKLAHDVYKSLQFLNKWLTKHIIVIKFNLL